MKSLILLLLFLFVGCGKPNATLSRTDIFSQLSTRLNVTPPVLLSPADITAMFGPPNETGHRTSANRYYRYNVTEGGFVEINFLNDIFSSASQPSTY